MSDKWTETEWLHFHTMRYRQRSHENETPAEFLLRKLKLRRKLHPIYPDSDGCDNAFEVADVWLHAPTTWAAHIDIGHCPTAADLIKMATDKDEQLQASSSISQLTKLLHAGYHTPGNRQVHAANFGGIDEEDDTCKSLVVDNKRNEAKGNIKAPGKFLYSLASNQSSKMPPRPCRNCRSRLFTWESGAHM